jgi:hypothetical protein
MFDHPPTRHRGGEGKEEEEEEEKLYI